MSPREVAKLGRVCGRLDATRKTEVYGLSILETSHWQEWSEPVRRLFEYAYHQAQVAETRRVS